MKINRQKVASINIRRRRLEGEKERGRRGKPRCGVPHSYEPKEIMKVELWAENIPSE